MKNTARSFGLALVSIVTLGFGATACTDTVTEPKSTVTGVNIFDDPASYRSFLAKLYGGLAVTGQAGPADQPDIEGIDEGFSQYLRGYWQLQELPTDEAVIGWGDDGLPELVTGQWGAGNDFITAMYYRIFYQIALVNEFLRETTDAKLSERGVSDALRAEIQQYRAEARFLRALSYWHGLDLIGNIPFVDETFVIGSTPPPQGTRAQIFEFIESELLDIRADLPMAGAAEYARADQGAVAMLLAKLYLNAEVYGQGARYTDAMNEAATVIAGPYVLDDDFQEIFLADNHTSPEIIFPIAFDGQSTQTYGGTAFIINASLGGSMTPSDYGMVGAWLGLRVTPEFVGLYEGGAAGPDARGNILYTSGQQLQVTELGTFTHGYAYPKFQNVTSIGQAGSNGEFPDTDFPLFRLADAYLMYAEACLRTGGGACEAQALTYVNLLRQRAYGDNSGDITAAELTLDFLLAERGRELAWEAHRRTDLIRFGLFTGSEYLWSWKGGTQAGTALEDYRALYPIPSSDLLANPNLDQNPGY